MQGVTAGGVRLARMVISWQAAVHFSTDFLCVSICLLGSSRVLSAMWFALQIAKFKKNTLHFESSWVQRGWEVQDEEEKGIYKGMLLFFLCVKAGFAGEGR